MEAMDFDKYSSTSAYDAVSTALIYTTGEKVVIGTNLLQSYSNTNNTNSLDHQGHKPNRTL
jgi:hypothetical protein